MKYAIAIIAVIIVGVTAWTFVRNRQTDARRERDLDELLAAAEPNARGYAALLQREYIRGMRFIYEKEFVAQRSAAPAQAVADLYRSRGLSTDTAVSGGPGLAEELGRLNAAERHRRFGALLRQWIKPRALATGKHECENPKLHLYMSPRGYLTATQTYCVNERMQAASGFLCE